MKHRNRSIFRPSYPAPSTKDTRAFFTEENPIKRDAFAARRLNALKEHQGPREKALRLSDVKEMFQQMKMHNSGGIRTTPAGGQVPRDTEVIHTSTIGRAYWSGTSAVGSSAGTEVCNWAGSTFLRWAHSTRLDGR
jgi:hypothetical protein